MNLHRTASMMLAALMAMICGASAQPESDQSLSLPLPKAIAACFEEQILPAGNYVMKPFGTAEDVTFVVGKDTPVEKSEPPAAAGDKTTPATASSSTVYLTTGDVVLNEEYLLSADLSGRMPITLKQPVSVQLPDGEDLDKLPSDEQVVVPEFETGVAIVATEEIRAWRLPKGFEYVVDYDTFKPIGVRVGIGPFQKTPEADALVACVLDESASDLAGKHARIVGVSSADNKAVSVRLALPDGALSPTAWEMRKDLVVAISGPNGVGFGRIYYVTPLWAAVTAILVVLVLFQAIGVNLARNGKKVSFGDRMLLKPIYLGADGYASISLMQITLWTMVAVAAIVYVFLRTWTLLSMTAEVMGLIGFAGATAVTARIIASQRRPFRREHGKVVAGDVPGTGPEDGSNGGDWKYLVRSANGFDLVKLQLLIFTFLIAAYVVYRVASDGKFPTLDTNLLLLMGVSNGVYLTNKFASRSELDQVSALKAQETDLIALARTLEEERAKLEARLEEIATAEDRAKIADLRKRAIEIVDEQKKIDGSLKQLEAEESKLKASLAEAEIEKDQAKIDAINQQLGSAIDEQTVRGKIAKLRAERVELEEKRSEIQSALTTPPLSEIARADQRLAELDAPASETGPIVSIADAQRDLEKVRKELKAIGDILAGREPTPENPVTEEL